MVASKKEKPIIEVKHLSKQYGIGVDRTYKTLCDSLTSAVRNPLKTLKGCRRQNDTFWALKDVNFEVEKGEVVGIIGRNGAGKSTLLKVLSRITYPTEGEVRIRGRVGSLLEVGTGFHPELTGRENVYFNGAILGMKKREIDDKFDEIVKFAGVEKFLDTPVKRYSSGMNVRLAFSVAAHLDPEILVVDEVLAVGDAAFQKKCLGKMSEVAEGGRTVLFVSHNMEAIRKLCTKCIYLDAGRIKIDGRASKVIDDYLHSERSNHSSEFTDFPKIDSPVSVYKTAFERLDGTPSPCFKIGENWQLRIFINVKEEIENLSFGLSMIKNGNSVRVTYSQPKKVMPNNYQLIFREKSIFFTAGVYRFFLRIRSSGNIIGTYENIGSIEITEVTDNLDNLYKIDVGVIANPMEIISVVS